MKKVSDNKTISENFSCCCLNRFDVIFPKKRFDSESEKKLNYQFSKLKHLLKDENMMKNAEGDVEIFLDELRSINNENMILSDSRKRIKKLSQ